MGYRLTGALVLCLVFLAAACEEQPSSGTPGTTPPVDSTAGNRPVVAPPPIGSGSGETALTWMVPDGWVSEAPSSRMRKAQYRVPGEAGDAECIVFYFGPGQGGDAMANAERWAGQFTLADGRPGREGMQTGSRRIGDIEVLSVEVAGTFQGGPPMMQRQASAPKPNQMLLGAVAEGPDANWFFKLTGPEATVSAQRAAFDQLIESIRQGG